MSRERHLWTWLRGHAKPLRARGLHLVRVEPGGVAPGIPDVNLSWNGSEAWIELKSAERPKRITTPIRPGIRDDQVSWLWTRRKAGGQAYLLIQVGSRHKARRYLIDGLRAEECREALESELAVWSLAPPDAGAEKILLTAAGARSRIRTVAQKALQEFERSPSAARRYLEKLADTGHL